MTTRFPPCIDILKKAPIYNGVVRSYFDINQGVILPVSTTKQVCFYSIVQNGKHRYYDITLDEKNLTKIFGIKETYILGGLVELFQTDEFKMFCDELFREIDREEYEEDIEIVIKFDTSSVEILFTFKGIPTSIEFRSTSRNLTECLLFEYFTRISTLEYKSKFSYNLNNGFSVRGTEKSLKNFFEKYFWSLFGDFRSPAKLATSEIWDSYYEWGRKVSKLVESLDTNKTEFILFSDVIPLKPDLCRRIILMLKSENYM